MSSAESVLVLESSAYLRSLMRSMLAGLGIHRVISAGDPREAYELAHSHRPDVIVAEASTTDSAGLAFVRAIRGAPDMDTAMLPVLVTIAAPTRRKIIDALLAGVHGIVSKPFSALCLANQVRVAAVSDRPFVRTETYFGPLPSLPELQGRLGVGKAMPRATEVLAPMPPVNTGMVLL